MGNLGRPGYGASLEGLWPYSYETCDVGTVWNQTTPDGIEGIPASNARGGRTAFNGKYNTQSLSFLQGQRLSACTCETEDHPGKCRVTSEGRDQSSSLAFRLTFALSLLLLVDRSQAFGWKLER